MTGDTVYAAAGRRLLRSSDVNAAAKVGNGIRGAVNSRTDGIGVSRQRSFDRNINIPERTAVLCPVTDCRGVPCLGVGFIINVQIGNQRTVNRINAGAGNSGHFKIDCAVAVGEAEVFGSDQRLSGFKTDVAVDRHINGAVDDYQPLFFGINGGQEFGLVSDGCDYRFCGLERGRGNSFGLLKEFGSGLNCFTCRFNRLHAL